MKRPPGVTLAHALPQRARFEVPALAGRRAACEHVARALMEASAVDRLTVRPTTGSVIVERDTGPLALDLIQRRLRELVLAERDDLGRPLEEERPEDQPGPTRVARAVAHAAAQVNADVRVALGHRADLGTLLPVAFAALSLTEVGVTGELPVPTWFNLLWWSLRSFMTFNLQAVEEEVEDGAETRHRVEMS